MRVATFNVLNGRSPADQRVHLTGLEDAVRELDADVLALQEVDHNQHRSEHADLTAVAAEAMGAAEHRFVAAISGTPGATWIAATGEEHPDSAAYGVALLSRYPVHGWHVVRLPRVPWRAPTWFGRRPYLVRDEPRVAVIASIEAPFGMLTVANTHLTFVPWWSGRQLRRLTANLVQFPAPVVLLGDLNMGPERAAQLSGMRAATAHPTFPQSDPRKQLDHILVGGILSATEGAAVPLPISDHCALRVELDPGGGLP